MNRKVLSNKVGGSASLQGGSASSRRDFALYEIMEGLNVL